MNKRARMTPADARERTFTSLKGLLAPLDEGDGGALGVPALAVELSRLRPNPDQPRRPDSPGLSPSSIKELAENIRQHGILQPLLVKDTGRYYQIVAGERRYRAAQLLGLETVPVRVIEPEDSQQELQIALAENLHRKNLSPLDEARALRTLSLRFNLSYRDLGDQTGRSPSYLHSRLQLLAHDDVRDAVERKAIGVVDATQLARVPDDARRRELLAAVEEGEIRGAALRREVQLFLGQLAPESAAEMEGERVDPLDAALAHLETLEGELDGPTRQRLRALGERVSLMLGAPLPPAAPAAEHLTDAPPAGEALERGDLAGRLQTASGPEPDLSLGAQPHRNGAALGGEDQPAGAEETVDVARGDARNTASDAGAPTLSPPPTGATRRAITRTREYRTARGYTLVNLIRVYWKLMDQNGTGFTPGDWNATPGADGAYLVSFGYRLGIEPREMRWWQRADGAVEPANEDARQLEG